MIFFFLVKIIFTLWTFTGGNFILKQILTNHNLNPIHRKNFLFPLSGPHHSGGLGRPSHLVTGFPSPLLSQRHCPLPGPADGHGEQGSTTWKRTSTELHLLQVKWKLVKTRISALKSAKNQRKPAGDYTAVLFLTFYSRGIFSEKVHKSQAHKKVNFYKLSTLCTRSGNSTWPVLQKLSLGSLPVTNPPHQGEPLSRFGWFYALYKWNYTRCIIWCLAPFILYHVYGIHSHLSCIMLVHSCCCAVFHWWTQHNPFILLLTGNWMVSFLEEGGGNYSE